MMENEPVTAVLHGRERFHRALPACPGKEIEDHLFVPFV